MDTHLSDGVDIFAKSGQIGGWKINRYTTPDPRNPVPNNGSLFFSSQVNETIVVQNESGYSGYSGIWFNPIDSFGGNNTPKLVVTRGYADNSVSPKAVNEMITIDVYGIHMGTYKGTDSTGDTSILRSDGSASLAGGNLKWGTDGTLILTGTINAASGTIGGWNITQNSLKYSNTEHEENTSQISSTTNDSYISKEYNAISSTRNLSLALDSEQGHIKVLNSTEIVNNTLEYHYLPGSSVPYEGPFITSGHNFREEKSLTIGIDNIRDSTGSVSNRKEPLIRLFSSTTDRLSYTPPNIITEISPFGIGIGMISGGKPYVYLPAYDTGWLANGNFSWDTEGNVYGPDTTYTNFDTQEEETIKAWELLANGSMNFNNGRGITLNSDPGGENQPYSVLGYKGLDARDPESNDRSVLWADGLHMYSIGNNNPTISLNGGGIVFNLNGTVTKYITWEDLFDFLEAKGATVDSQSQQN